MLTKFLRNLKWTKKSQRLITSSVLPYGYSMITSVVEVASAEALVAKYVSELSNEDVAADSLLPDW